MTVYRLRLDTWQTPTEDLTPQPLANRASQITGTTLLLYYEREIDVLTRAERTDKYISIIVKSHQNQSVNDIKMQHAKRNLSIYQ